MKKPEVRDSDDEEYDFSEPCHSSEEEYNSSESCDDSSDDDESDSSEENSIEPETAASTVTILVKFSSSKEERNLFKLKSSDTISRLKTMIKTQHGVPRKRQTLVYRGRVLENHETLAACKVERWSIIHAIFCPEEISNPNVVGVDMAVKVVSDALRVEVKPWYTGQEIKAIMESMAGISLGDHVLSHWGKLIEDSSSVLSTEGSSNMINNEDQPPIYLLSKFQITARGCGWEEVIMVSESHTVLDVKKMVEDFAEVKPENLMLCHGNGGDDKMVCLDDDEKTLLFYDVKEKATIWVLGRSWKLTIKMPQVGDKFVLSYDKVGTIKDIKDYICKKMGIPCSSQKLFRKGQLFDDEAASLETFNNQLEAENSVIYVTFGAGDDDQVDEIEDISLIFERDKNEKGLIEYKVVYKSESDENSESGESSDSDSDSSDLVSSFEIKLRSSCTIFDLKTAIESLNSFRICTQKLYWDDQILEDWETVDDDITKWSSVPAPLTIHFETPSSSSNVGANEKIVSAVDRADETLEEVLVPQEVLERIRGQPGFFLDGILLEACTLLPQIEAGSVLCLNSVVQINVTGPNGATTKVHVNPSYKFKDVKEKIELDCGIPFGLQRLTHDGDELNDDMTIGLYEASLGSLWKLRWNFCGTSWSFFYPWYKDCCRTG
ncbi:hypothetical protein RchiOBHm_Chr6g0287491 [Rosa chinensis]|uniref:Ubiquitin-like domain-containing protein n=1 Tax=Rosa chinensis TaxID=74649 RepID=A0A2P6PV33_ROSCH|nr:hypothetical protein RchiOBHm_Chr6g0287491 [Rosa chinensis]